MKRLLLLVSFILFISGCTTDEGITENNTPEVIDPAGTVVLDMSSRDSKIDNTIYIEDNNFKGAVFCCIGKVDNLSSITSIPINGWTETVMFQPEYGYVAYIDDIYYRLYAYGNYIVKYNKSFSGSECDIMLADSIFLFESTKSNRVISFKNSSLFDYNIEPLSDDNQWCQIDKYSTIDYGLPNALIMSIQSNLVTEERCAEFNITSEIGGKKKILIQQRSADDYIEADQNSIIASPNNKEYVIDILSNAEWSANAGCEWIKLIPCIETGKLIVNVYENITRDIRNAVITISTSNSQKEFKISVKQEHATINTCNDVLNMDGCYMDQIIQVETNVLEWNAISNSTWCKVNVNSEEAALCVEVEENTSGKQRTAVIDVIANENIKKTITVNQAVPTLSLSSNSISLDGCSTSSSFTVDSNVNSWSVSDNSDWITTTVSGNIVNVIASKNLSGFERTGEVNIELQGGITKTVNIKQLMPTLQVQDTYYLDRKSVNGKIEVQSNVDDWIVRSNEDWCVVEKSGSNLIINCGANTTAQVRRAKVSVELENIKREIEVVQNLRDIGDYYNDGINEGVVFEISSYGENGKIISLDKFYSGSGSWYKDYSKWCVIINPDEIGATSEVDGIFNMNRVMLQSDWEDTYPIFRWANEKNSNPEIRWYIPTINELLAVYNNIDLINSAIISQDNGSPIINNNIWSSVESSSHDAACVYMKSGNVWQEANKTNINTARAVMCF